MSYRHGLAAIAAIALLGVFGAPAAYAETGAPSFAVQNTANSHTRMGYNAYARGDYAKAAVYSTKGTAKSFKKSRRSIAYANLCASLGQQNTLDAALEACDAAIELSPANWRALNNRGVVKYLAGDKISAAADFANAATAPKAELAQANADLLAGIKLANVE